MQIHRRVQGGLPTQGRQQGVGTFFGDNRFEDLGNDGFDVGTVRHFRIGHDGGGVGVDQNHPQTLGFQNTTGLGAGIVELGGLPDYDWPRANHHH